MIAEALLDTRRPAMAAARVGGLTVLERQLFVLARAGIRRVWLSFPPGPVTARLPPTENSPPRGGRIPDALPHGEGVGSVGGGPEQLPWPEPRRKPEGLEILRSPHGEPEGCRYPLLVQNGDFLVSPEALKRIAAEGGGSASSFHYEHGGEVLRVRPSADAPPGAEPPAVLGEDAAIPVQFPSDKRDALPWLLRRAARAGDGFMARHFDRRISLAVTRWLLPTPIRPNHMTLLSTAIGLAGAAAYLRPGYRTQLLGAGLVWLHSVLDGCDGELARTRFQESRWGKLLDFWGDNAVHLALFGCMAVGLSGQDPWARLLGPLAALGALGSAWLFCRLHSAGPEPGEASKLQKLETTLAQRDFIYLLLLAAAFDRSAWFLRAAGIGSPIYLALLVFLTGKQPAPAPEEPVRDTRRMIGA